MLRLIALLVPLSLDTFTIAAALGAAGIPKSMRLRVSLVFMGCEAAMPLIGIAIGQAVGEAIGSRADYLAGAALAALGAYLLLANDDDDNAALLARAHGLAVIGLGISVSLDELAIGFGAGLLHLPLVWAILLLATQSLLAVQIGLRVGARLSAHHREQAERLAGVALLLLGV
ncbi:MAG: manganese efflux pump family protein, partial [Gaiellales bacterium]|nr:manganese efflux pump family protein [Gaiellales bacterium]